VVWGKQAEAVGKYLAKGRQVYVEGSIRSRQYDDKDGNKRYITEIVARDVRFLGGAQTQRNDGQGTLDQSPATAPGDDREPWD